MIILIGLAVGFLAGRYWWQGLAVLLLIAVLISGIATAVIVNDPATYPFRMSVGSFALTVMRQLALLAPGYAVGIGGRWLLDRRNVRQANDHANGVAPAPMRVWKFIWLRPLLIAAVPSTIIVAAAGTGGSNANGPFDWAVRIGMVYLIFYALFVGLAAWQWKKAKPVKKAGSGQIEGARE